jgi:hypothetical protein
MFILPIVKISTNTYCSFQEFGVLNQDVLDEAAMLEYYGRPLRELRKNLPTIEFDVEDVPKNLRFLAHYARFWGVEDEGDRDTLISAASTEIKKHLKSIVHRYKKEVDEWLFHPGDGPTTAAYVAFTIMQICASSV